MAKKPTLPPRKWYSLQQAADKLTREFDEPVTIDDLIHYWIHGYLMLSLKIDYKAISLDISKNHFFETKENDIPQFILANEIESIRNKDFIIENVFFSQTLKQAKEGEMMLFGEKHSKNSIGNKINEIKEALSKKPLKENDLLRLNGLVNIPFLNNPYKIETENPISSNGLVINGINYFFSPKENDRNRLIFVLNLRGDKQQNINLKIDDFYILHNDLIDFINGNNYRDELNQEIEKIENEKQATPRKEANQTEFIKALIKAHYGTDEPEKVRTLLGKNGDLTKLFARKGIELNITPETVRNWLKAEK